MPLPFKLVTAFVLSVISFKKGVTSTELKTKNTITFYKGAAPTELKTTKIFRTSNYKKLPDLKKIRHQKNRHQT